MYEHRYFAVAARLWAQYANQSSTNTDGTARPSVAPLDGVIIRDSLFVHSRNLIEFYGDKRRYATDVVITDFDVQSPPPAATALYAKFKTSIDAHLHHITAWRDVKYRELHSKTAEGSSRARPDWDVQTPWLVKGLFDCMAETAGISGAWQTAFVRLHGACEVLRDDPAAIWPPKLTEASDISTYLASLGL